MAQYINKDDIIEKISELQSKILIDYYRRGEHLAIGDDSKLEAYNEVLSLLNKLKVKEVDLDKEFDKCCENCTFGDECDVDTEKHFIKPEYTLSHL